MSNSLPATKEIHLSTISTSILIIKFNNKKARNAISPLMYKEWLLSLKYAKQTPTIKCVILTGAGDYYSSGTQLLLPDPNSKDDLEASVKITKDIVTEMIDFPKVIIGAVNGPCIGIACTTVTLCDLIFAVPNATFNTPFMNVALCAEGASSYIFPRTMGLQRATEFLLLNKTYSSKEFKDLGIVNQIFPNDSFFQSVVDVAFQVASLPANAVVATKKLVRNSLREKLHLANDREMDLLVRRFRDEEFREAMIVFFANQKAKKEARSKI